MGRRIRKDKQMNKDNLIAITKAEIVKNLPNGVRFTDWELELLSNKVIKRIITEVNNNTFDTFVKG